MISWAVHNKRRVVPLVALLLLSLFSMGWTYWLQHQAILRAQAARQAADVNYKAMRAAEERERQREKDLALSNLTDHSGRSSAAIGGLIGWRRKTESLAQAIARGDIIVKAGVHIKVKENKHEQGEVVIIDRSAAVDDNVHSDSAAADDSLRNTGVLTNRDPRKRMQGINECKVIRVARTLC